jgi:hypothetical protein
MKIMMSVCKIPTAHIIPIEEKNEGISSEIWNKAGLSIFITLIPYSIERFSQS